jgi:gliding motility-associated-like protein
MKITLIISLLFTSCLAVAQSFYNTGAEVTIGTNTIFTVSDSLVNNGTLTNNGNMVMGGVWLNLGTYNPGSGEITFNSPSSSGPQIINHNNQSFSKLTISGGGDKLILANMTIVGELILEDGIIVNQNDSKVIFQQGAVISGGSEQSHIDGPVYQLGTGNKLFPVGNGTDYLPVQISGISSTSEVGVELVEFATPQAFSFNSEISDVSSKRYWEIDLVTGSLTGTQLSLPLKGDEGLSAPTSQYVIVQSPDSPIEFESLGQLSFTGTEADGSVVSENSVSAKLVSIGALSEKIIVYNAISANGDTRNAIMRIGNISLYPKNMVSIFNRWGDKVFEVKGYDNDQKVFVGTANVGGNIDLPAGTYFYTIDKGDGSPLVNGYLSLKK